MERNDSSTTNVVLIILLVLVVGFIVWYIAAGRQIISPAPAQNTNGTPSTGIEVNLGGSSGNGTGSTGSNGTTNP